MMMAVTTSVFSLVPEKVILNTACVPDFTYTNSYGKFTFFTCNSRIKLSSHKGNILLSGIRKEKHCLRTVVFGLSHDDTGRENSSKLDDDSVLICADDVFNSEEPANGDTLLVCHDDEGNFEKPWKNYVEKSVSHLQPVVEKKDLLLNKMKAIQLHVLAMEQWNSSRLKICHRKYTASATNLIHFLALKSLDIEQTKEELLSLGLLNLESINSNVYASISACIQMLAFSGSKSFSSEDSGDGFPLKNSLGLPKEELASVEMMKKATSNRDLLLGTLQGQRMTHIMVTVGEEAAEDDGLVVDLIKAGTTVFRINCAHGNPDIWEKIICKVNRNSQLLEKPCRILMDLAGPKLRTGTLKAGPCVAKISPKRNVLGNIERPAQIWLSARDAGPPPAHLSPDVILHVDGLEFLSTLELGDSITFSDARRKRRTLKILSKYSIFSGVGFMAECKNTAYIESGTVFSIKKRRKSLVGFVVDLPPTDQFIRLRVGDLLTITRDAGDKQDDITSSEVGAHKISCPSGYLFDSVKPGERISFDDGKIWGVVKGVSISEVIVSVTHAGLKGTKLGSEKSINIPDSNIRYEGLTSKDLMDLDFVAAHADMVGISFIRSVNDMVLLRQELARRKFSKLGIVLKIETKGGFEKLPLLILEGMKSQNPLGVMIARGDLAVECGWEKLADIQEEIISFCSAAHVPVILATQVLESLVKSGVPSRAEITDAANGRRVSCVMLNKGSHILQAVNTLDIILNSHFTKTKPELKPLMLSSDVNSV